MDNYVAGIKQHPISLAPSLGGAAFHSMIFYHLNQLVCHRRNLPGRLPTSDYHVICNIGLAVEINYDNVFGLVIGQGGLNRI